MIYSQALRLIPHRPQHPGLTRTRWRRRSLLLDGRKFKQRLFTHVFTSPIWLPNIVVQQSASQYHRSINDLFTASQGDNEGRWGNQVERRSRTRGCNGLPRLTSRTQGTIGVTTRVF